MSIHLKKIFQPTLLAVIGLTLFGCKTTYQMEVDAISNPQKASGESYILVPRDPDIDTTDLGYQETVSYIKTALSSKGMYEALDIQSADMIVEVDYGMEPPRQEFKVVEEPIYVRVRQPPTSRVVQSVDPKTGRVSSHVITVPGRISQELAGYQERLISVIVNEKYLELVAKENVLEQSGDIPADELWSVSVRNKDSSDNLREYLPILASGATDHIGEDTKSKKKIRIKEDDEVVQFIKKGIPEETPISQPQPTDT